MNDAINNLTGDKNMTNAIAANHAIRLRNTGLSGARLIMAMYRDGCTKGEAFVAVATLIG